MGTLSWKGNLPTGRVMPCNECVTKPCCRGAYPASIRLEVVDDRCINLCDGGCSIYADRPAECARYDCSVDLVLRHTHPEVDDLLKRHGYDP